MLLQNKCDIFPKLRRPQWAHATTCNSREKPSALGYPTPHFIALKSNTKERNLEQKLKPGAEIAAEHPQMTVANPSPSNKAPALLAGMFYTRTRDTAEQTLAPHCLIHCSVILTQAKENE